jgi:antitoxin FitA
MMTSITISLTEERVQKLKALAATSGISPEELVRKSVDQWLEQPATEFAAAAAYVLKKNEELYQRLAK